MSRVHRALVLLLATGVLLGGAGSASAVPIEAAPLPDGVVLWTPKSGAAGKPSFFGILEDWAKVLLPSRSELPFDRSVAFLVGVSHYKSLKPLPFVKNDLQDMKDYLLQTGFDQVYVAADGIVSSDLIEGYMMNKFPAELGPRDRLLFYYAGHGADARGRTGYLQFANARSGDFARHVLPVSRVLEWGRVNEAAHMLFLLDTCSSGLAFTARGSAGDEEAQLIQTLSGRGSRTVVTAGTADEETFEVKSAGGKGNGVFTRAFLAALERGKAQRNAPPFLTIDQVIADVQISVGKFAAENRKNLNPRLWTFDDDEYRGSFVFLNPAVRQAPIKPSHLIQMKATPRGEEPPPPPVKPTPTPVQATPAPPPGIVVRRAPEEENAKTRPDSRRGSRTFEDDFGIPMSLTELRKSDKALRGKVLDSQGAALPGVTVTLTGPSGSRVDATNAHGDFNLFVNTRGEHDLVVELVGFRTIRTKLDIGGSSVRVVP